MVVIEKPLLIRCSQLGYLMTEPKKKTDKEAGELSQTAKSFMSELFLEYVYCRKKEIANKYLEKGVYCEEDSLTLLSEIDNILYLKNKDSFENNYIKGTPDIILDNKIIDIKTCWDIFTFHKAEMTTIYEWQLRGYMYLTGKTKAELIYTLVDAPEHLIIAEQQKAYYTNKFLSYDSPDYMNIAEYIEKSLKYTDIPKELRIKRYSIELENSDIDKIICQVLKAREYYSNIQL